MGGSGVDSLNGTQGSNILIGGQFTYYNETTKVLNRAAIEAIMTVWGSGDSYSTRVASIRVLPLYPLTSSTVTNDSANDSLLGGSGTDISNWFWIYAGDTANNKTGEAVN